MMANADKFHLLLSFVEGHTNEIDGFSVKNVHCKKLLGVHFDEQLNFDFHTFRSYVKMQIGSYMR